MDHSSNRIISVQRERSREIFNKLIDIYQLEFM